MTALSSNDTSKPHNIWLDIFVEARQGLIKQISDWLLGGVEYISFVVPTKRLNFFFTKGICEKDAILVHICNNSFTTSHKFNQAFELARDFINTCYLSLYWLAHAQKQGVNLKPFRLEFCGFATWRKRFKSRGKTMSAILGFNRPVRLVYL